MKCYKILLTTSALLLSSATNAALLERLGGLAYYDDVANLTWLADANATGTTMNWVDANAWATGLSVEGVSGWRLANTLQPDAGCDITSFDRAVGLNCTGSEMGNLFYNVLGNTGGTLTNIGPFSNLQGGFWSATEYARRNDQAYFINMGNGYQSLAGKGNSSSLSAWAVQSGDVSPVPVPAAVWLLSSGLLGLVGVARRKKS